MTRGVPLLLPAALASVALGCTEPGDADPCAALDPAVAASAFVVVTEPQAGASTRSPLRVRGCSRTFESNVVWQLRARDGSVLASGHTSGGGVDGAASFSFAAHFETPGAQLGHLDVFEPDVSDGEGFPGGRSVLPVALLPGGEPPAP